MKVLDEFLKQYNKEFDFYQKLSQVVADKIEDRLIKRGIKAEVTYRAKRPDRLKAKLIKRNAEKEYETKEDIYSDIVDLAGVRVSLYFPSERETVDEIINELFLVECTKNFPTESSVPKSSKRFSGYWATHYRIKLSKENISKRFVNPTVEIQVASVLMHAWSEVEHDLVYKPFAGELSAAELAILDEINGLVISGEIALERLKTLITKRTRQNMEITNQYGLTNFILNTIDKNYLNKIKLGDTYILNNYLNTIKKLNTKELDLYIHKINIESDESITDQLLNMFLIDFYDKEKPNLKIYFKNLNMPDKIISYSESYIKCWIVFEKAFLDFLTDTKIMSDKYLTPDFKILVTRNILTLEEANQLKQLRLERSCLLHGKETATKNYLISSMQFLKGLTQKTVDQIQSDITKVALKKELNKVH